MPRPVSLFLPAVLAACASPATEVQPERSEEIHSDVATVPAPVEDPAPSSVPPVVGEEGLTPVDPPARSMESSSDPAPEPPASVLEFYRERYDDDGDGRITPSEYTRSQTGFKNLDADKNGVVSAEDFARRWDGVPRGGHTERTLKARAREGPDVGANAPVFRLPTTSGEVIDLVQFLGKKPVVLVFGSFT